MPHGGKPGCHRGKLGEENALFYLWGMLWNSILYLFLGWYVAQVFSGETGKSKPFYFLFTLSFWCGSETVTAGALHSGDTAGRKQAESAQNGSIVVHKLSKAIKDKSI